MATATFSGSYGHNMTLELRAERSGEPNIAGNSSNVHVTGYLHTNGYASMWGVSSDVTITINGGGAIEHPAINIGTNSTQKIFDHTYTIGHNNDGTKTVGIKLSVGLNTGGYGSAMVAFDYKLPDIPRASSVSDVTGTLGSAMTININRKVSSFTHTVKYNFGALNGTIATGVGTSVSWTPPLNLATAMPNKTSDWGNITVDTYNGSTKVGSATCRLTLNVPDSIKPTFTDVTLAEGNSVVGNVFTQENTFVEVLSQPTVTFNGADGAYNSTVTGYKAEIVGKNMTVTDNGGSFGLLKFNGTATVRASVQDSRGRWSDSKEVEIEVIEYSAPLIGFTLVRSGADKTTLTVIRKVRISPLMVGGVQKNKMTLNFKTRPLTGTEYTANNGSASGVWTTQSELVNSNANLAGTFSGAQSWEVVGTVSDLFTSASHSDSIGTEVVHTAKAPTAFGFGKIPEHTNAVDSDWQYYFNNKPIQHHKLTNNDGRIIQVAKNTDMDTIVETGFYCGEELLHRPTGSGIQSHTYFRVQRFDTNAVWCLQEAIDFNGKVSAFRVKRGSTWDPWQYYAVQNKVVDFTAVNQTKVYKTTLAGPYGFGIEVTRSGNVVTATMDYIHRSNTNWSGTANETIPVGWRPVSQAIINAIGEGGGGTSASLFNGSYVHLSYKPDGSISGRIKLEANPLWFGATISWITTDPFPS